MKVFAFWSDRDNVPGDFPADADDVRYDVTLAREVKRSVTVAEGIQPLPGDLPWAMSASLRIPDSAAGDESALVATLRGRFGANVLCTVSPTELIVGDADSQYPVKNLGVLEKRDVHSVEEFGEYWNHTHAPITISYAPTFVRYITNVVRVRAGEFPWHGIVEQSFASREDLSTHVKLAADGRPRITADIPNFVSRMQMFVTEPGRIEGDVVATHR